MSKIMTAHVEMNMGDVQKNFENITKDIEEKIELIFKYNEAWGTSWMKINAPWTDDTGAARAGLTATSYREGQAFVMLLAYSVHYGIWLEVANSGRFQVLNPAMRAIAEKIMSDLKHIIDGKPPSITGNPTRTIPPQARKLARKGTANKSGSRRSRKSYGRGR